MAKKLDRSSKLEGNQPYVWLIVTVFLLIFGSVLAWNSFDDYGNTLEKEYQTLESQARLGDVQIAGALRSLNLVLQSVIDDVQVIPKLPAEVIAQKNKVG